MPLIRRIPKRGFNNANFKTRFAVVNLDCLNRFEDGSTVTGETLLADGIIRRPYDAVKILGTGKLTKRLTIVAHRASASAKAAIEKAGGSISLT